VLYLTSIRAVGFAVIASAYRVAVRRMLQANWLVLLEQRQVLLEKFCAIGRNTFHSQRLRGVLNC